MKAIGKIAFLILCIITSTQVFAQNRIDFEYDTIKKTCHVYEINDANITFKEHIISDCKRILFFDNNKFLVYFDYRDICHFCNVSTGYNTLNAPVVYMQIKDVVEVKQTEAKRSFTRNSSSVNEYLYVITYIDTHTNKKCIMEVDKEWFGLFSQKCE